MVVDTLGLVIFLIGIALMVIELANPGYFIGVAGTTGILVGLLQMATNGWLFENQLAPFIVTGIALVSLLVSIEFYRRFAPAVNAPETLSSDALVGMAGRVVTRVEPNTLTGKVKVGGIVWSATSDALIEEGNDVRVTKVEGVHLVVVPKGSETDAEVASKHTQGGSVDG